MISRTSAGLLFIGGLALLFAPDAILPRLAPGLPASASWIGQLIAAAWLGVGSLNWLSRNAILGGIYGRPVVLANAVLYAITALSLIRPVLSGSLPAAVWCIVGPSAVFATLYARLLFGGPIEKRNPSAPSDAM
jgi:hypothetical protein